MHQSATISIRVLRGRNLLAADRGGTSDPYVTLCVGDSKLWRSPTKQRTLNPDWDVQAIFEHVPLRRTPYAVAEVWDSDVASSDDPLGKALLPLEQLLMACADGLECEVPLARQSHKNQASGSLWIHVAAVPEAGTKGLASPPLTPILPSVADEYSRLCGRADSRPHTLGAPATVELLEARLDDVLFEFGGRITSGALYVSNARLVFAAGAQAPAVETGHSSAGDADGADAAAAALSSYLGDICDDDDFGVCGGGVGLLGPNGSLFLPLHSILRIEEGGGGTSGGGGGSAAYHYFMPSAFNRSGVKEPSAIGSGGSLTLSLLPALELSLHFVARVHGVGPGSVCALVHQRLSYVQHNPERVCAPLLADPSALPLPPVRPPEGAPSLPSSPLSSSLVLSARAVPSRVATPPAAAGRYPLGDEHVSAPTVPPPTGEALPNGGEASRVPDASTSASARRPRRDCVSVGDGSLLPVAIGDPLDASPLDVAAPTPLAANSLFSAADSRRSSASPPPPADHPMGHPMRRAFIVCLTKRSPIISTHPQP